MQESGLRVQQLGASMRPSDASGSRAVEGWRAMLVTGRRCVLHVCMLLAAFFMLHADARGLRWSTGPSRL